MSAVIRKDHYTEYVTATAGEVMGALRNMPREARITRIDIDRHSGGLLDTWDYVTIEAEVEVR